MKNFFVWKLFAAKKNVTRERAASRHDMSSVVVKLTQAWCISIASCTSRGANVAAATFATACADQFFSIGLSCSSILFDQKFCPAGNFVTACKSFRRLGVFGFRFAVLVFIVLLKQQS